MLEYSRPPNISRVHDTNDATKRPPRDVKDVCKLVKELPSRHVLGVCQVFQLLRSVLRQTVLVQESLRFNLIQRLRGRLLLYRPDLLRQVSQPITGIYRLVSNTRIGHT